MLSFIWIIFKLLHANHSWKYCFDRFFDDASSSWGNGRLKNGRNGGLLLILSTIKAVLSVSGRLEMFIDDEMSMSFFTWPFDVSFAVSKLRSACGVNSIQDLWFHFTRTNTRKIFTKKKEKKNHFKTLKMIQPSHYSSHIIWHRLLSPQNISFVWTQLEKSLSASCCAHFFSKLIHSNWMQFDVECDNNHFKMS